MTSDSSTETISSDPSVAEPATPITDPADSSPSSSTPVPVTPGTGDDAILAKYAHLDPGHVVPAAALKRLVLYYDSVKAKLGNPYYLTVVDFTQHSSKKRMHVIDVKTGTVTSYLSAHGKGSETADNGYATKFSNVSGSNASSLGIYRTGSQITSSHGPSMLLNGLESTNSNALDREIILHGAWYVSPEVIAETGRIGRSLGCPAVEDQYAAGLSRTLSNGSLFMIWANR